MRRFVALILLGWGMAWGEVPNLEGWSLLNAGAVQVRYRRGHEAAARRADRVAEDLYRRIDERFSLAPPGPFVLWIADSETDFVRISGGRIVDWAQGFAFPDRLEAVVLFSGGPGEFEQLDRLVRHEIAHLCLSVLAGGSLGGDSSLVSRGICDVRLRAVDGD
ncbi:MAG: hypothetical protein KatS3mg115_1235 [Candidatus Poribacteria bacterium]|nr:MAG: hypothetical protein KatS3mg115_1235 [Candidatus Poribacteria bacterium]